MKNTRDCNELALHLVKLAGVPKTAAARDFMSYFHPEEKTPEPQNVLAALASLIPFGSTIHGASTDGLVGAAKESGSGIAGGLAGAGLGGLIARVLARRNPVVRALANHSMSALAPPVMAGISGGGILGNIAGSVAGHNWAVKGASARNDLACNFVKQAGPMQVLRPAWGQLSRLPQNLRAGSDLGLGITNTLREVGSDFVKAVTPDWQSMHAGWRYGLPAGAAALVGGGAVQGANSYINSQKRQAAANADFSNRLRMSLGYLLRPEQTAQRLF